MLPISVVVTVNSAIVRLCWHIGQRIRTDVLAEKRSEYGREILATLSQELMNEFGQGFPVSHLSRMMALAGAFPDEEILATLSIDDRDYYLDLLFYHRKLRRLVAVELKIGDFEAGDKGQMELYSAWLKRHECESGEAEPLGLILCAGKSERHVELLEPHKSGIHVATYWTEALPKKQLENKLNEAVQMARAGMAEREG